MTEETLKRPDTLMRQLRKRAVKRRLEAEREPPMVAVLRRRKERQREARALASAALPDGTSPKMRAALVAAKKRADEDPKARAAVARAALARRVQMAKEEGGLPVGGEPELFMGMGREQLEREVAASLPPPMREIRPQKPAAKKGKKR